jgi:uncharacterized ferritin-like protein (DUF455 family)
MSDAENKSELFNSLCDAAVGVLGAAAPEDKVRLTLAAAERWRAGGWPVGEARPPVRPARPNRPELKRPADMPKRSTGPKGKIALVHALAHIELNAVDLAWDILARFTNRDLPRAFVDDWVDVAREEAEHYRDLARRLRDLGTQYGDLPAHDGLWEAAQITADDLCARLAVIPMTLEARGLDTTPATCAKLRGNGDEATAAILERIFADEIKHLAVGVRWFEFECARRQIEPHAHYHALLAARFTGTLKPPFNIEARAQAGMGESYLRPWMDERETR